MGNFSNYFFMNVEAHLRRGNDQRNKFKIPEETSVYALNFDPAICESCDTCDCLMRCQYMTFDLEEAKRAGSWSIP